MDTASAKDQSPVTNADIWILATGGTIDKAYPRMLGGWAFEIAEPAAGSILDRVNLNDTYAVQSVCKKDSQEITSEDRQLLLESCAKARSSKILVTHGTDTLIETASYLGGRHAELFPEKVVCVVGSMRPEKFVDTDAHFNVGVAFGALSLASPGVYVCMNGCVFPHDKVCRDTQTGLFRPVAAA